jgi:hypothetical protein
MPFTSTRNCHTSRHSGVSGYYPFGMQMQGRDFAGGIGYRWGFQSQENENGITDESSYSVFKFRFHNSRLSRFWSLDPLSADYESISPYAFSENQVINAIEFEGLEKVALAGAVLPSEYGRGNAYNATHVREFQKQAQRLEKLHGYHASQVFTADDVLSALKQETAKYGGITQLSFFLHSDPNGLYMRDGRGVYSSTIDDITQLMSVGAIKFNHAATIFINGCNPANNGIAQVAYDRNISIASEFALKTGVSIIAATGKMVYAEPGVANGKFKIDGEGEFLKLVPYDLKYNVAIPNPEYKVWKFWEKASIFQERMVRNILPIPIGSEISVDDYVPSE